MVIRMVRGSRKKHILRNVIIILIIFLFLSIEMRPLEVHSSSIFITQQNTEIKMHVLMNTWFPVDEETMVRKIILEEQKINGFKNNSLYTVSLYRSFLHYQNGWEYKTLICDGAFSVL